MSDALVIIPTYNEKENIDAIIRATFEQETPFNILIVDVDQEAVAGFGGRLEDFFTWTTAKFCRFDRAIEKGDTQMTCVLYDTKQRNNLKPNGY